MARSNRSVPTSTILPHVVYPDVETAVEWLTKTFGFREHYRYGEPGAASGAQIHLGDAWIMVKRLRPGAATPAQLGYGTQSLTVFVRDVEDHFQRTKSSGARILEDLHETVYGELQYAVEDFAGHHWLFSWHARDLSPDAWGATVREPVHRQGVTIQPMLSVRRGGQAVDFYKAAFGAEAVFQLQDDDGNVIAQLSSRGASFWVADESPENLNFSPETLGGSSARMVVVLDDPDAAFQRAVDAGGKVVWPIEDQPYGWRVGRVVDPFGHHWEIGKPLTSRS